MPDEICEICGANKKNYQEALGEPCACVPVAMSNQEVFRIINLFRQNGVRCFHADGVTSIELDDAVQGHG
ncbi:hypothetical protein LCGC14_1330870 [marine sediment metagenome]|uniref:Uncharacterized protein n=1 Tax=marine sediment metagenome TaxID=412755 RepID=A0A0F9MXH7_9ZZZZ